MAGVSRFYVENFSFSQCRNIPYGNPLLLHYFQVPKKFLDKGGSEFQDFPSKVFCFAVPENFARELVSVHYFRESKRFMLERVISRFSVDFFCLTVPKILVDEPFCAVFQKTSGSEEIYG